MMMSLSPSSFLNEGRRCRKSTRKKLRNHIWSCQRKNKNIKRKWTLDEMKTSFFSKMATCYLLFENRRRSWREGKEREEEEEKEEEEETWNSRQQKACQLIVWLPGLVSLSFLIIIWPVGRIQVFALLTHGCLSLTPLRRSNGPYDFYEAIVFTSITSIGNLFQCRTTRLLKKFLTIPVLHLFSFSGRPLFLVRWLVRSWNNLVKSALLSLFRHLNTCIKSPLSLLFSNVKRLSRLSRSLYGCPLNDSITFTVRRVTLSNTSMSFLQLGDQNWTAYSRRGRTIELYSLSTTSGVLQSKFLEINPSMVLAFLQANLHCLLCFRLLLMATPRSDSSSLFFGSYTPQALCIALLNAAPALNTIFITDDVNAQVDTLTSVIVDCIDQCALVVTTEIKKPFGPWIADEIPSAMTARNALQSRLKRDRYNLVIQEQYKRERN